VLVYPLIVTFQPGESLKKNAIMITLVAYLGFQEMRDLAISQGLTEHDHSLKPLMTFISGFSLVN
jgi:hypothetical protein